MAKLKNQRERENLKVSWRKEERAVGTGRPSTSLGVLNEESSGGPQLRGEARDAPTLRQAAATGRQQTLTVGSVKGCFHPERSDRWKVKHVGRREFFTRPICR